MVLLSFGKCVSLNRILISATIRSQCIDNWMAVTNMSFPDYVAKFRRKMVEIRSRFKESSHLGLSSDYWVPLPSEQSSPILDISSSLFLSSTPPAEDVLHQNDGNGGLNQFSEDMRLLQNSLVDIDRNKEIIQQKSKDLDQYPNNRRPSSRTLSKKSAFTIDPDRDREDPLKNLPSTLPVAKPSYHRPNGIKGNFIKGEQFYSTKSNGALSGHEPDDLIAMGTLWSPNNPNPSRQGTPQLLSSGQQQTTTNSSRNNGISNNSINSYPFKVIQSSGSVSNSISASNNLLSVQRKFPNTSTSIRPILVQNNGISARKNSNILKEQEDPKYTDPMIGAPSSFQQRIIELGALEGDTVRWERSKRLKKKKQDRDS